jgi:hypothetical protein
VSEDRSEKDLTFGEKESIFLTDMNLLASCSTFLKRGLPVLFLAFPLVALPLGQGACAASCDPEEGSAYHRTLGASLPLFPDAHVPSCCALELLQGGSCLSTRQSKQEKQDSTPGMAAAESSRKLEDSSTRRHGQSRLALRAPSTDAKPLYLHHAALLI